jgi:DNA modification methylase
MEKMTEVVIGNYRSAFENYLGEEEATPLLFLGDALAVLEDLPDSSIDCVLTSPPYWGKREYESGGIGLEKDYRDYLRYLAQVALEIKRVLKPTESFWLNIGDSYWRKSLLGIPWRLALDLTDRQGWILRNAVVWDKVKGGMDSAPDRLANVYETVFHFVKRPKGYYYDLDAIRAKPQRAKVVNGKALSATGVSGVRYRQQIESSTTLSEEEKTAARKALDEMLANLAAGKISDFRMVIRGQQRPTHSDSEKVSGRAKELREKGFYFLRYHPKGSKPNDVWRILPEDSQGRSPALRSFPHRTRPHTHPGHLPSRRYRPRPLLRHRDHPVRRSKPGPPIGRDRYIPSLPPTGAEEVRRLLHKAEGNRRPPTAPRGKVRHRMPLRQKRRS